MDPEELTEGQAHASVLLQRQDVLQAEARRVIAELGLPDMLSQAGVVTQHGSSISGLMVWRDIDFGVVSPGLTTRRAFEIMEPLLSNPQTARVRYANETGPRIFLGKPENERIFFMVYYDHIDGETWKFDIAFWLHPKPRGEHEFTQRLMSRLTEETRVAILWIKQHWHVLPAYPTQVNSVDIYTAVLDHNVRTLNEFDSYLEGLGKPIRTATVSG